MLEPGIVVDIRTTCGSLGRTLTARDRRRLWRKVEHWKALQTWRKFARNWRTRGKWRREELAKDDASASSMARKASRVEKVEGFGGVTGRTRLAERERTLVKN